MTEFDIETKNRINNILESIIPSVYECEERKTRKGRSAIGRPVDLQITRKKDNTAIICIEVANVNSTQLINEACRLFYDTCPLKLLVLGKDHVPKSGTETCNKLLARLYGQDDILSTPARVVKYNDEEKLVMCLKDLLLID